MRDFDYKPALSLGQFLKNGFAEHKCIFTVDLIRKFKEKNAQLMESKDSLDDFGLNTEWNPKPPSPQKLHVQYFDHNPNDSLLHSFHGYSDKSVENNEKSISFYSDNDKQPKETRSANSDLAFQVFFINRGRSFEG